MKKLKLDDLGSGWKKQPHKKTQPWLHYYNISLICRALIDVSTSEVIAITYIPTQKVIYNEGKLEDMELLKKHGVLYD